MDQGEFLEQESTFDPILLLFPSLSKQEGKEFVKQNM